MSIRVENISKSYGLQLALDDISFTIKKGEITGFLGPNGAGKSTMMKILTGYLISDKGNAYIDDMPVKNSEVNFRMNIGYLPEHNPLYQEMYIKEYLRMVSGFYSLRNPIQQIDRIMDMTGLKPESSKKIGLLSKGYKQRVGLAQALIHDPSVLILDEPTSGLDPNQLEDIRLLIKSISAEKTVLLSTHIMQEVEALCSRVIIINKGKIVTDGASSEVKKWAKGQGQKVYFSSLEDISKSEINSLPYVSETEQIDRNEFLITSSIEKDIRPELYRTSVEKGWTIIKLVEKTGSFEEIFKEMTK